MEQRKLISSKNFGKLQKSRLGLDGITYQCYFEYRDNYDYFLEQTPNIGDFVPAKLVDGVWIVLEEPIAENYFNVDVPSDKFTDEDSKGLNEYHAALLFWEEAKTRVVFEGFEVVKDKYFDTEREFIYLPNGEQVWRKLKYYNGKEETFFFTYYDKFKTIENLVKYNLQLTEQKAKELGL